MDGILEFPGKGGCSWTGLQKAQGEGKYSLEFKTLGGISALNFQRGKTVKALLEIIDLITFLVCKLSTNPLQKQDKD